MPNNTGLDLGYVAGVIDARGHITVNERRPGNLTPRVRITTRKADLLHWLADRTGVTVKTDDRGYARRPCGDHCTERHSHQVRQSAYWNVDGARAVIVLHGVLPWLVVSRFDAIEAIRAGSLLWPIEPRSEVTEAMRRLGWPIPSRADLMVEQASA